MHSHSGNVKCCFIVPYHRNNTKLAHSTHSAYCMLPCFNNDLNYPLQTFHFRHETAHRAPTHSRQLASLASTNVLRTVSTTLYRQTIPDVAGFSGPETYPTHDREGCKFCQTHIASTYLPPSFQQHHHHHHRRKVFYQARSVRQNLLKQHRKDYRTPSSLSASSLQKFPLMLSANGPTSSLPAR